MNFKSVMHIAYYTNKWDEMINFYTNKLGGTLKVLVRYKAYLDRDDRPSMQEIARKDPERVFNAYIELAPGQFIELFPKHEGQKDHIQFNEHLGYSHFALLVDDIEATYKAFEEKGITIISKISKGPSGTWQFWAQDPDGNRFEMMQYTQDSYQVVGHID